MSVCDPVTGMHSAFGPALPIRYFVPQPRIAFDDEWDESIMKPLEDCLKENSHLIAAMILEPVAQGAGGMWFYHPQYLREARRLCDEYGVYLIFDEIATGFWRTGKCFAWEHAGVEPDIMCIGKGLTAGYMTSSAVLTTKDIADTISNGEAGVVMHGPTFMGNPMACAVGIASLELLASKDMEKVISDISTIMKEELSRAATFDNVKDVRVLGAIGVIEMKSKVDVAVFQQECVKRGVWIRPFGFNVYIMPPYVITEPQLRKLCREMVSMVKDIWTV